MWMRILTGREAGKKFELKQGDNIVGRASDCDIVIDANGISKKHACVRLEGSVITITDLRSSNGIFVNGIRIIKKEVTPGADKIGFHDILVDFKQYSQASLKNKASPHNFTPPTFEAPQFSPQTSGSNALDSSLSAGVKITNRRGEEVSLEKTGVWESLQKYIDDVAMPGIYHLAEVFEFRLVIGGMILSFIMLMTFFSVLPMMRITKESVEKESRRRALTISRNLAAINQNYLQQGVETAVSIKPAEREEGVRVALVISNRDGHVIAPSSNLGEYPDQPFIHKARKENRELVEQIDDELIGASVPIVVYSPDSGQQIVAHAVVLYDMGSLAIDSTRYISLFSQILLISLVLGFILYFFMVKLFEHPLEQINSQLDEALKDDTKNLDSKLQIPIFRTLLTNINSLLQRSIQSGGGQSFNSVDYASEANNIVRVIGNPAAAIDKDRLFLTVNTAFEDLIGMRLLTLQGQSLELLQDQALRMSIQDLLAQSSQNFELIVSNQLDFSGVPYELDLQCIQAPVGVAYYLLTMRKVEVL